jgi:glycosyltransferase involved in cell wall biosynthesis
MRRKPERLTKPDVSVILPVWNGERFLEEALASILLQTLGSLELIVIDDGSTDRTEAIVRQFAREDPRVVLVRQKHLGMGHALNAGIRVAGGRYLARMDADDIAAPSRLEKQVAFLEANPSCVAVGSNVEAIDAHGHSIGHLAFPGTHREILHALMAGATRALAHPTVLMRKDAVVEVGGYRQERCPTEDLDLWLRLAAIGELANLGESLLRYRRHTNTVWVREGAQQMIVGNALVDTARRKHGLKPLRRFGIMSARNRNATATYHLECARIALGTGNFAAASRHARASIRRAPLWAHPYAALAAAAIPPIAFALFAKIYNALRRRPSTMP